MVMVEILTVVSFRTVVRAIVEQATSSYEYTISNSPEAYAFDMLSNQSLFNPSVMNRTDTNISSPTYGYWIPPPGKSCSLLWSEKTHGHNNADATSLTA